MTEAVNWGSLIEQAGKELEPVAKGTYDVVVEDASDTQTTTQKLMYKLKFRIQGGPYNNRVLWNNITLTTDNPQALAMFFRNMDALGLNVEYFKMNPSPSEVAATLIGRSTRVVIDHRMYQGQLRENVKQMIKVSGIGAMAGMPVAGGMPGIPNVGGSAPVSSPGVPNVPATPQLPVPTAQPATAPPSAPAAAVPPPVPQVATPAPTAPAPQPVPAPAPVAEEPAAPAPAEDPEMAAFKAWQASQAKLDEASTPAPDTAPPAGPPAPPPVPW